MDDEYCAFASPLSNAAEFHAVTGASTRASGDMEQIVPPKPCCIGFTSWASAECRRFAPVFNEVAREFPHVRFYTVDIENEDAAMLALEQSVGSDRQLPVFKLFQNGMEVSPEVEGARRDDLVAALQRMA